MVTPCSCTALNSSRMTLLSGLWNKVYGYVLAGGAILALLAGIYLKGREDAKVDMKTKQVQKDLSDLKEANKIDEDVRSMSESDVNSELAKWMRDK